MLCRPKFVMSYKSWVVYDYRSQGDKVFEYDIFNSPLQTHAILANQEVHGL